MNIKLILVGCILASIAVAQNKISSSSRPALASSDCGQTIQAPFESKNIYSTNHIQKQDFSSLIPVDAVSASIAYRLAQRATVSVPEENLAYGFKKTPENAVAIKPRPDIPEEKLSTFDSKVVELKDFPCRKHKKVEEEEEEEEDEEEEVNPNCGLGYLNYGELGYRPLEHEDPKFAVTQFESELEQETPCNNQEKFEEIGSCGYRPGRIVNSANRGEERFIVTDDDDFNGQF